MGQYWHILNLDKRQKFTHGKLGEWLMDTSPQAIAKLLTLPILSSPLSASPATVAVSLVYDITRATVVNPVLGTLQLPVELLDKIFDEVDDLHDAACLGLANTALLTIGRKRIDTLLTTINAPWAGDRMIVTGDNADVDEWPQGVLTKVEEQELRESRYGNSNSTSNRGVSLYDFASRKYREVKTKGDWRSEHRLRKFEDRLPKLERERFHDLTTANYKTDHPWVLCNISKYEYVHEDAVTTMTGGKSPRGVGFGEVLVTRICWSADNTALAYEGDDIHHGVWAGDRFEITTMDRLERKGAEKWKDVSEEVLKVVEAIWKADCGDDWPESG